MSDTGDPFLTPGAQTPGQSPEPTPESGHYFRRDVDPNLPQQRKDLVSRWARRVRRARDLFRKDFDRMKANTEFVLGAQWTQGKPLVGNQTKDDRYVANIALRHVTQTVASLYPNNPEVKFEKRPKLVAQVWDGDLATLQAAQQKMALNAQAMSVGLPGQMDPNTQQILMDFQAVQQYDKMVSRVGKTLQILWDYNVDEQVQPFKAGMKMSVRRATITGVGYVKLGFQRAMQLKPEVEQRLADMTERLANVERLAADIGDDQTPEDGPDAEALRVAIQSLREQGQMVIREGLTFDYPDSWAIIPDPKCRSLKGFIGADWVAQEYLMRPDEIEEVWGIDVGKDFTAYSGTDQEGNEHVVTTGHTRAGGGDYAGPHGEDDAETGGLACVWEVYHRKDGTIYTLVDGYPDFLVEPHPPEAWTDHFWPWYPIVFNEGYHAKRLFPLSDIDLVRDMQMELNRARQGLREQRHANRPAMVTAAGALEQEDKDKIATRPANALLELNGLAPGQKVDDLLQSLKMPEIQAQLYDTAGAMEDLMRVVGDQSSDLGPTAGATATEVSTAEASQHTARSSVMDDLDDMLSSLARNGGQILMLNVSQQIVQDVVGPGAVWPQLDNQVVAKNVYLQVVAGSSGRPNKQQEVMNLVQVVPLLQRIPGISPEWLAREILKRMDDRIDLTDAFVEGQPSMEAMNRAPGMGGPPGAPGGGGAPDAGGPNAPSAQGGQGPQNAQAAPPTNGLAAPRARDPITNGETVPQPGQPLGVKPTPGMGAPTP
jgi:hypothetical protein